MNHLPVEQLRIERRSYIIGTLLVWAVIVVATVVLVIAMKPELFAYAQHETMQQALNRINQVAPFTWQQQLLLYVVEMAGAVALFFLNWRFSFLLQRPRSAFVAPTDRPAPPGRWLWWAVLLLNSMFYASFLIPQLILTWVLAGWGKEEIARLLAPPPPPPSPEGSA